jgi:hypothetical protein
MAAFFQNPLQYMSQPAIRRYTAGVTKKKKKHGRFFLLFFLFL